MTDDGSYGEKGVITVGIEEVLKREPVHLAVAIGPAVMMKFVALLTKKYDVPTIASLNTIMVDGTGMCGACRVSVAARPGSSAWTARNSTPTRSITTR